MCLWVTAVYCVLQCALPRFVKRCSASRLRLCNKQQRMSRDECNVL
jgi:hypothetical protein